MNGTDFSVNQTTDGLVSLSNIIFSTGIIIVVGIVAWFVKLIRWRLDYKRLNGSLKAAPFNLAIGSLPGMIELAKVTPSRAHPHGLMTMIQRKYELDNVFLLDNYPATGERQLIIADPEVAAHVTQSNSLPKSPSIKEFVGHLTGPTSILYTEGALWKKTRALFNPGFSIGHLSTLIPSIVDDSHVFVQTLNKHAAAGDVFPIEEDAAHLTIDIMGHVVLDHDLNAQTGINELVESFRKTINWTPPASTVNPLTGLNPIRPLMYRYYTWKMDGYLENVLEARFKSKSDRADIKTKRKPAIDLALDEYETQQKEKGQQVTGLDPAFKRTAIDQMKTFLFAGHDTSSSTICYIYHLLNLHPESLAKLRRELNEVFEGREAGEMIKENPNLINKLPYTLAVIKETLRVFPPASTVRQGHPDVKITYKGQTYETEGHMVWVISHTIHRRADLFPSPDEFIPERFLPAPDNWQEIPKDAWRPFEKGPRACIGQELAMLEMKIILAMTAREFDIKAAYEEWDRKLGREKPGDILGGRRGMFGYRAYQELIASAKPVDGLPAKVTKIQNPYSKA
ncbi:cytochrome P450 monooxygenase-like protein [Xylogone sp. PMI_703]|nr:cytochrome P450 monooxygenase-like protein [Xylogone sp. PMI_703]